MSSKRVKQIGSALSMVARVFLFCIFPVIIGLYFISFLEMEHVETLVESQRHDMSDILSRISVMGNPETRYQEIFRRLSTFSPSARSLLKRAAYLQKHEGSVLEIYVYDGKGILLPIPGARPVPKSVSEKFLRVLIRPDTRHNPKVLASFAGKPDAVRIMSQNPSVFSQLGNPFGKSLGGWWKARDASGRIVGYIVAFINMSLVSRDELMDRAILDSQKSLGKLFTVGFIDYARGRNIHPEKLCLPQELARVISDAPLDEEFLAVGDYNVMLNVTDVGQRLFCAAQQPSHTGNTTYKKGKYIILICCLFSSLSLILFNVSGSFNPFRKIHRKLVLLILCSGGILLSALSVAAYFHRRDRETGIIQNFQENHLSLLGKIDRECLTYVKSYFRPYEAFVQSLSGLNIDVMKRRVIKLDEFVTGDKESIIGMICTDASATVFFHEGNVKRRGMREAENTKNFLANLSSQILSEIRLGTGNLSQNQKVGGNIFSDLLGNAMFWGMKVVGKVSFQHAMSQSVVTYIDPIYSDSDNPELLLFAMHNNFLMQRSYLRMVMDERACPGKNEARFVALPVSGNPYENAFPKPATADSPVLKQMKEQAISKKIPIHRRTVVNGREYLITAIHGKNLSEYVIFLAQPFGVVAAQTRRFNIRFAFVSTVFLVFVISIALYVSGMLLKPVQELNSGLEKIRNREFSHRVKTSGISEFEKLGVRFNKIFEDLYDLKIAKSLQENLWPDEGLSEGRWAITGKCVTAANLGGDFHDWFRLTNGYIVIAIGDVAGHGIPASLITAAAKAELALCSEYHNDPAQILRSMNRGFIEQAGNFRPMSFWVGLFNPSDMKMVFSGAGHPYAVLITRNEKPKLLGCPGYPLGFRNKRGFSTINLDLSEGARLILFSDGLVEAARANRQQLGYDKFLEILDETRELHPEEALQTVFIRTAEWSGKYVPDDDQTLVILDVASASDPCNSGFGSAASGGTD